MAAKDKNNFSDSRTRSALIKENVFLKEHTTFQVGGQARYFLEVASKQDLQEAIGWAKQKGLPFFVLGGGSNLLVSDAGFFGLVLKLKIKNSIKIKNYKLKIIDKSSAIVQISAGISLFETGQWCFEHSLSGLEWSTGIPKATIGGALFMNAGAFGTNMADITEQVEAFDVEKNKFRVFDFDACEFGYKESIFKRNKNLIIVSAKLKFEKKQQAEIKKEMQRVLSYRKERHPMQFPCAGSIFKNPRNIPAGEAIQKAGLSGKQIGQAKISEQHCNFIVNLGGASSVDVKALIDLAKKQVKEKLGVELEEEIQYL